MQFVRLEVGGRISCERHTHVRSFACGGGVTTPTVRILSSVRTLARITADPEVMGGRPCIRGIRVTVGTIVGLVASGHSREEILSLYPYLEPDDITEALAYAAWRSDEFEVPISPN